ncbi:MAG TPA: FAD-dependent oxidoreductase, partial [Solirubrobacteraceae bacterium]|nr:FAD-dependent oxidoreductase [Solirubrobacteraceae bacterium]
MFDAPSWWWADLGGLPAPRPALDGDRQADVCVVGAGYTGLWTAYELGRADPSLDVVVLEREVAGYGASGRNGGWVLGEISTGSGLRSQAGQADVEALQQA